MIEAILKRATRLLLLTIVIIGFTFSYSIFDAMLSDIVAGRLWLRMLLWTLVVSISYSIFTLVTIRKPVPASFRWTFHSRSSIFIPTAVIILIGLAILFPSPKHDRLDMLYIVGIAVLGEEALFRGLLWDLIDGWTSEMYFLHLSGTIWLTGLAFGVMHLQYYHFQISLASMIQTSYSFGVGLMLGAIRKQTKSVVPPMFVHSAFNSLFNLMLTAMQ